MSAPQKLGIEYDERTTLEDIDAMAAQQRLVVCGGNKAKTARDLGIGKARLNSLLKRLARSEASIATDPAEPRG